MTTFVGRFDRQLDPKGRLALPASIRQKFESQAFLTIGENGCLEAYTPEDHDQMAQDLRDKERRREVDRNFVRTKSAKTFEVPIDAQGRVLIDSKLREFAGLGLGSRVAVIGVYDRIEIWNAERFDDIDARSSAEWAETGPTTGRADSGPTTGRADTSSSGSGPD
jgi:MraZ protein